jgi:LuxR family maltose regulon positive regulatory protein
MTTPLLRTKLHIPPLRPAIVPRPRLIERLDASADRRLTLISAPAGFGKTTLLSEWVWSHEPRLRVAWLSLDEGDNDPVRFLSYLIAALRSAEADDAETELGKSALSMLRSSHPPPLESILTVLVNDLTALSGTLAIVLDDYHIIDAQPVHDVLTFLLNHLSPPTLVGEQPQGVHLVLASRIDPPLPLARMRARGQMAELRGADLRFTPDEIAVFLNQVMGLDLSAEDITALAGRTEGWIAGLQLAALALQGTLSMQGRQDAGRFVQAFAGSHRYILDYLAEEVLHRQPKRIQTFLLQTSILDRLSGPLCDAILEISESANRQIEVPGSDRAALDLQIGRLADSSSHEILEYLERANLFIVPLDDERRWYRYHALFAELLHSRLSRTQPDSIPLLHRQASAWYAQNDLALEAVRHALAAGDVEQAVHLIEGHALAIMNRGQLATVTGWLADLPGDVVRSRPWLCIFRAWATLFTGQVDAVEPYLRDAEHALDARGQTPAQPSGQETADLDRVQGHIATIRAYALGIGGDVSAITSSARQALERLPEEDAVTRSFALTVLGSGHRLSGNLTAASQALSQAIAAGQKAGDRYLVALTSCNLAAQRIQQGQLRQAAATFQDVLEFASRPGAHGGSRPPIAGIASTGLATVHREWNDLETAARLAKEGVELSKQWGQAEFLFHGYMELAQVLQRRGDGNRALEVVREAQQIARSLSPWFANMAAALETKLRLRQGDTTSALRWMRESGLSSDAEPVFQHEALYRTLARLLIAQGRPSEALRLLARLLTVTETAGALGSVIDVLVLRALSLQAEGTSDQALPPLERALTLAEPEGYVRAFVDEGEPMAVLLRRAAAQGIAPVYVGRLLAAFGTEADDSSPLLEPLSDRELTVLRLVAAGLSNREIAEELYLSLNTIKTHAKSIYGKLNAHNRTQAVNRARELGLL